LKRNGKINLIKFLINTTNSSINAQKISSCFIFLSSRPIIFNQHFPYSKNQTTEQSPKGEKTNYDGELVWSVTNQKPATKYYKTNQANIYPNLRTYLSICERFGKSSNIFYELLGSAWGR